MEMCDLRGDCRPGHSGEPAIDESGSGDKPPKCEEVTTDMGEAFDPDKYEMTFCPYCQGDGKLAKTPEGVEVCKECGGFGLIRK
jgi:DnaJ-class molecular chaperone